MYYELLAVIVGGICVLLIGTARVNENPLD